MKIGKRVKAKKYVNLRKKQALVNWMIKNSHTYLKPTHKAYKELLAKKRAFYNKRGIRTPAQFTFKPLQTKDLKAYEELLDSIIEGSTWFNEDKYNDFVEKTKERLKEEGIEDVEGAMSIFDYDIVNDIVKKGVMPSDLMSLYEDGLNQYGMDINDFVDMLKDYVAEHGDDATADEFFAFAYLYQERFKDFKQRVDAGEYLPNEFKEFKDEYPLEFYERK